MSIYKISLSDAQADKLADWLSNTAGEVDSRVAEEIRAQIPKPAIKEPTEWGSVVRARRVGCGSEDTTTLRWQRQNTIGDAWVSEPAGDLSIRYHSDWRYLFNPEVLRVGIGEPYLQQIRGLLHRSPSGLMTNEEVGAAYKELRKGLSALLEKP